MSSEIIYQGKSKKGKEFIIRYPVSGDLHSMLEYINTISKEQTFIAYQGEQVFLEDEEKYLEDVLSKIKNKKAVQLLAFYDGNLIGNSSIALKDKVSAHEGVFGISVANGYRGEGIGKKLMEIVLSEAKKHIPELEIITLGVFANNPQTIKMYENFGFKEYGRLPNGIIYKGRRVDHVSMYKNLSS